MRYLSFFNHFVLKYGYDRRGKIYGQGLKGLKIISPTRRPLKQMLQQLKVNLKDTERPEDINVQFGNFYLWLFNHYAAIRAKKRAWISKEIAYARHADELFAMIPNAKLIIMVRDGRDAALSMFAKKWAPTVRDSIDMWRSFTEMTLRALDGCPVDRYKLVQYEELVSDFPRVFNDILTFFGVPSPSPDIDKFFFGNDGTPKSGKFGPVEKRNERR